MIIIGRAATSNNADALYEEDRGRVQKAAPIFSASLAIFSNRYVSLIFTYLRVLISE